MMFKNNNLTASELCNQIDIKEELSMLGCFIVINGVLIAIYNYTKIMEFGDLLGFLLMVALVFCAIETHSSATKDDHDYV